MSHPSRCYQHCQESNSSFEYLSISFWWYFGGLLPSSISQPVPFFVMNVPNHFSQLQNGLLKSLYLGCYCEVDRKKQLKDKALA